MNRLLYLALILITLTACGDTAVTVAQPSPVASTPSATSIPVSVTDSNRQPAIVATQPTDQAPVLTPELETCLRDVLSPAAFSAVFETGARRELAAETPLITSCFDTHTSGESSAQTGDPPGGQPPVRQPPSQEAGQQPRPPGGDQSPVPAPELSPQLEACLRDALSPAVFTAVFVTGSRAESAAEASLVSSCFETHSSGESNRQPTAGQGPALTPQLEACLRNALTPDAFTAVFVTGSRGESAAEASLIGQCFEAQGSGGQQGTPPSGQGPGGQPPSQGSGGQQGTPPGGQAPAGQGPALTPQLEACLRGALTPDAFTAVFITGSRGESAAEAPLIGQCFEAQGSGGSGGQQGTPPGGQAPGGQPPSQGSGSQQETPPAGQPPSQGTGSQQGTPPSQGTGSQQGTPPGGQAPAGQPPSQGAGGQQAAQSSWQTRETHLCYRAGLGTQAFTDVVLDSKRDATTAESNTMATCRSLGGPGSDMPVFDLAQVYRPDFFPRVYPETVIGTSAHAWFEFMDVMADDSEFKRLQATGTNAFHSVILYDVASNGEAFLQRPKEAANLIIRARIRGLAIHLSLDTFTYDVPCNGSHEENLASYIRVQTQAAIAFAKFADALNVEYLSPGNEHEGGFQGPCLDPGLSQDSGRDPDEQMLDPQGEPGLTARVAVSSTWHLDVLPDVRAVFGGLLLPNYGTIHPAAVTPGYDGLMFTLDHAHLPEDKFSARVNANYRAAAEAAGRSGGIPWYVNAYLPYSFIAEVTNPEMPEYDPTYVVDEEEDRRMRQMQEVYVAVSIAAFKDFRSQSAGGYLLAGWIDKGKEIRDSNLEKILIENFG